MKMSKKIYILTLITISILMILLLFKSIQNKSTFAQKCFALDNYENNKPIIETIKEITADIPGDVNYFTGDEIIYEQKKADQLLKMTINLDNNFITSTGGGSSFSSVMKYNFDSDTFTGIKEKEKYTTQRFAANNYYTNKNKFLFLEDDEDSSDILQLYDVKSGEVVVFEDGNSQCGYYIENYCISNNERYVAWTRRTEYDYLNINNPFYYIYIYDFEMDKIRRYIFEGDINKFNSILNIQINNNADRLYLLACNITEDDNSMNFENNSLYYLDLTDNNLTFETIKQEGEIYKYYILDNNNILYICSDENYISNLYLFNPIKRQNKKVLSNINNFKVCSNKLLYIKQVDNPLFYFNNELYVADYSEEGKISNSQKIYTTYGKQKITDAFINQVGNKILLCVYDLKEAEKENILSSNKRHLYFIEVNDLK